MTLPIEELICGQLREWLGGAVRTTLMLFHPSELGGFYREVEIKTTVTQLKTSRRFSTWRLVFATVTFVVKFLVQASSWSSKEKTRLMCVITKSVCCHCAYGARVSMWERVMHRECFSVSEI